MAMAMAMTVDYTIETNPCFFVPPTFSCPRLVQAMCTYGGHWMSQIDEKIESLEEMVDFIEVRKDDPAFLQEECQRQKVRHSDGL